MITVRLIGGLGNQMFQYATGRRLADHHKTNLTLDVSGYHSQHPGDTPRHYELGTFAIRAEVDERGSNTATSRILTKLRVKAPAQPYNENGFAFNKKVLTAPDGIYLNGYWQSERYFNDIRPQLLKDFTFISKTDAPNQTIGKQIQKVNAVSLHVRRGDYVANANANHFHGTKTLGYYHDAIALLAKKTKDPHFFVFSDDPEWCKDNIKINYPTTFVTENDGNSGYKDLHLMSKSKHHIIANSSFSWWGAWLNPSPDKVVIAPKQWFNDSSVDTRDIYPKGWLKI
jgi:hypothetical protein